MKKVTQAEILPRQYIDNLLSHCSSSVYNTETELIYEGQSPTAGYLLLKGEIHFIKRKKIIQTIKPGTLFGVTELMENSPLKHTVKIAKNSKVCILDRSTVKELLEKLSATELPNILKTLVA